MIANQQHFPKKSATVQVITLQLFATPLSAFVLNLVSSSGLRELDILHKVTSFYFSLSFFFFDSVLIFFSGCQLLSTRNPTLHHTIRAIMPRPKKRVAQCREARRIRIQKSLDQTFCQSLESPSISVLSSMQMAPRSVRFPRAARKDSLLEICSAINTCFPVFTCQDCMMRVPHSSHAGLTPFLRPDIAGSGLKSEWWHLPHRLYWQHFDTTV